MTGQRSNVKKEKWAKVGRIRYYASILMSGKLSINEFIDIALNNYRRD